MSAATDLSQRSVAPSGLSFGGTPLAGRESVSGRLVPEEDLKAERERWLQQCMHEVWNLENAAFERINSQIQEATTRIEGEVTRVVLQRVEEEREERVAALARIRSDMQVPQSFEAQLASLRQDVSMAQAALANMGQTHHRGQVVSAEAGDAIQALRSEIEARSTQHQVGVSTLQVQAERLQKQVALAESQINDLRMALEQTQEQQELRSASLASDLRQELTTLQVAQIKQLQEQTTKSAVDFGRSLQEALSANEAAQKPLRAEFKADLQQLRSELETSLAQADENAGQIGRSEAKTMDMSHRLDEVCRKVSELRQDQLSESTVLRGRLEAAVGDREEQFSQYEAVQLLLREEQGRRSAEVAGVASKLEAVERRLTARLDGVSENMVSAAAVAAQQMPPALPAGAKEALEEIPVLARRLEAAERRLAEGGGVSAPGEADLSVVALQTQNTVLSTDLSAFGKRLVEVELRVAQAADEVSAAAATAKRSATAAAVQAAQTTQMLHAAPAPPAASAVSEEQLQQLQAAMNSTREDIAKLAKDVENERRDRCRALTEMEKGTEEVARAAATALERAEQRLAAGGNAVVAQAAVAALGSCSADGRSSNANSSGVGTPVRLGMSGFSSPQGEDDRRMDSGNRSMNTNFARLIGEMDAELRIELTSRVRLLTAELRGELLREVALRVGDAEAKSSVVEINMDSKIQRFTSELSSRLNRLESTDIGTRLAALESESRRCSATLGVLLEDSTANRKSAISLGGPSATPGSSVTFGHRPFGMSSPSGNIEAVQTGGSLSGTMDGGGIAAALQSLSQPVLSAPASHTPARMETDASSNGGMDNSRLSISSADRQSYHLGSANAPVASAPAAPQSKILPSNLKQSLEDLVSKVNRALNSKSQSPSQHTPSVGGHARSMSPLCGASGGSPALAMSRHGAMASDPTLTTRNTIGGCGYGASGSPPPASSGQQGSARGPRMGGADTAPQPISNERQVFGVGRTVPARPSTVSDPPGAGLGGGGSFSGCAGGSGRPQAMGQRSASMGTPQPQGQQMPHLQQEQALGGQTSSPSTGSRGAPAAAYVQTTSSHQPPQQVGGRPAVLVSRGTTAAMYGVGAVARAPLSGAMPTNCATRSRSGEGAPRSSMFAPSRLNPAGKPHH